MSSENDPLVVSETSRATPAIPLIKKQSFGSYLIAILITVMLIHLLEDWRGDKKIEQNMPDLEAIIQRIQYAQKADRMDEQTRQMLFETEPSEVDDSNSNDESLQESVAHESVNDGFKKTLPYAFSSPKDQKISTTASSIKIVTTTTTTQRRLGQRPSPKSENLNKPTPGFINQKLSKEFKYERPRLALSIFNQYIPSPTPPSPNFYFHTKMPRCGSTTMRNLIDELAVKNNFKFIMIKSKENIHDEEELVNFIDQQRRELHTQYGENTVSIVMKHSTFINFTRYEKPQPTYLNVVRNPIDRYISHYYALRFGVNGRPISVKPNQPTMSDEKKYRSIEEHFQIIKRKGPNISIPTGYHNWICGTNPICNNPNKDLLNTNNNENNKEKINYLKQKTYEYTKIIALNEYHSIGILERLRDSLQLFEVILPKIYTGAVQALEQSQQVEKVIHNSASIERREITNQTRLWLERTHFKYDMDLYKFILAKFNLQYDRFVGGIN